MEIVALYALDARAVRANVIVEGAVDALALARNRTRPPTARDARRQCDARACRERIIALIRLRS
jgi:hypothetical protein